MCIYQELSGRSHSAGPNTTFGVARLWGSIFKSRYLFYSHEEIFTQYRWLGSIKFFQ